MRWVVYKEVGAAQYTEICNAYVKKTILSLAMFKQTEDCF